MKFSLGRGNRIYFNSELGMGGLGIRKIRKWRKGENPGRNDWNWGNGHFGETWKSRAVKTPRNLQK